ncbi:hypothetical protein CB0940_08585 [Cercospora beticola]|uniref:Uncharacterized protein n=1 Tax=Cercospora beticola TaxID=122368 RepID=A0A2G5HQP2_CERBT|nr:hypothetical protein CB0940_08585 [Cercospora beticola]PIA94849.1 hypothetical protein CB0940_08585 [Cercospora beticola]WPB05163.1 hypothetical protein RHO25_009813 [Cercospora beticola]
MAERTCREASSRRQSFRRSLAEAGLPVEALERLEAKRKQLDESIHKYIAAKEREYKSFEKDEIQRHKLGLAHGESRPRRTSSESTQDTTASPPKQRGQQQNVVAALVSAGVRREHIGQPHSVAVVDDDGAAPTIEARPSLAGLTDRRASEDRDKEFIGVFTPTFLPALDNGRGGGSSSPARADSAPPSPAAATTNGSDPNNVHRVKSDTDVQAQQKRPLHLQLASRTSSSGSSADGNNRLASALKSPTHPRSKRKRVSLAVGDTIVAPSDNVPITMGSNNSTPSHSRTRSPADRETSPKVAKSTSPPKDSPQQTASGKMTLSPLAELTMSSQLPHRGRSDKGKQPVFGDPVKNANQAAPQPSSRPSIDGDLDFALDEEDMIPDGRGSSPHTRDRADEIMGRIKRADDDEMYEPSEGILPEDRETGDSHEEDDFDAHAQHIEFHPGSVQQTNNPGFRRPSVSHDPVYTGRDYDRAEHNAVTKEIYGSSFNRPTSKSSFTPGSLGESFMAMNAARMMKERRASDQTTQVRS